MDLIGIVEHHGYAVVAAGMFLTAAGVPLPASVLLLAAGAAANPNPADHEVLHHGLHLWLLLPMAWLAAVCGDTLLYLGGRYTGWWLLAGMCRVSVDTENCIFRSADYFYRRGPKTLLFAKFVPGLASLAAPLAGSLGMRLRRFLRLDATGALAYVSAWMLTGFVFRPVYRGHHSLGRARGARDAVCRGGCCLWSRTLRCICCRWCGRGAYRKVQKVSAAKLHERLQEENPDRLVVIADVRSHGYYDPGMQRIKNSIRVEPHRLKEEIAALREFMAPECEIYLYCSCIRDTTSVRIAHLLEKENCRTNGDRRAD